MADPDLIAGTATLSIDGKRKLLRGEFSYMVNTPTREWKIGMDGPHGYSQKFTVGTIKAKLSDGGTVSVTDLGNITGATITVELANGKVITGTSMTTTEQPTVDAEEGTIDLTWSGRSVTELLAPAS